MIEHNVILDNNRSGYARFWESGAMKFFRMTGCVIRHNTCIGGDGPGLWLDWEHYNNRLEGNYFRGMPGFAIGVEASPGPHLIANNVIVDIQPGGAWFQYGVLAWSSARIWAVSNTLDTANGMMFAEGNNNRGTAWQELTDRNAAVVNNLIMGNATLHQGRLGWVEGNRLYGPGKSGLHRYARWADAEFGKAVETSKQMGGDEGMPQFELPEQGNYRFPGTHNDANAGVRELAVTTQGNEIDLPSLVRHDFNGLLRFPEDGVPVGAFRNEPKLPADGAVQIEIEWRDRTMERRW